MNSAPSSSRPLASGLRSLVLGLSSLVLAANAAAQTNLIPPTTYSSGQNVTVSGTTITNDNTPTPNTVTVSSGAIIKFRATTSITLKPGFSVASGGVFRAFIFVDANTNGMDDAWEATHGVTSPTEDPDHDDLSNFVEYLLGTNPTVSNSGDTSGTNNLKVHRPQP